MHPTSVEFAALRAALSESPLLSGLADVALDTLAGYAEAVTVRGGEALFRIGEAPEAFYLVAVGRLCAVLPNGHIVGYIGRLEPVGEMGVISGEPRTANVIALRDSLLYRFSREAFHAFVLAHPAALLSISKVLVERLSQNGRVAALQTLRQTRAFAVYAGMAEISASAQSIALTEALRRMGSVMCMNAAAVDAALGNGMAATPCVSGADDTRLMEWLNHVEASHDYLVYDATGPAAWQQRALHQADRVLVIGKADSPPAEAERSRFMAMTIRVPTDLVLLRTGSAGSCLQWCEAYQGTAHYFLRSGHTDDLASLVRQLTGRGLGIVLGGGGARGFAHIGLLRALDELKLPIDLIGGTSMGAFVSALHAMGHDWQTVRELLRETFVANNPLNDYLLPRVALIEGKKLRIRLESIFGDTQIEQLLTPFFCVTTNLTKGEPLAHRDGRLSTWVGTSMCIPGLAPPVAYQGDLLADGAVVNSLPTDIMQSLGRGPIIASDVSTGGSISAPGVKGPDFSAVLRPDVDGRRINMIDILFRVSTLTSESGVKARAARADLYLRMPVNGVNIFDWKRLDHISEMGYQYALAQIAPHRPLFSF